MHIRLTQHVLARQKIIFAISTRVLNTQNWHAARVSFVHSHAAEIHIYWYLSGVSHMSGQKRRPFSFSDVFRSMFYHLFLFLFNLFSGGNLNKDCWDKCGKKAGICEDFCGQGLLCCRRGWSSDPHMCRFLDIGCHGRHCCVKKGTELKYCPTSAN